MDVDAFEEGRRQARELVSRAGAPDPAALLATAEDLERLLGGSELGRGMAAGLRELAEELER